MTIIEKAASGKISAEMKKIAAAEGVSAEAIRAGVAAGKIVIPANKNRKGLEPSGIGAGLSTKVNANIGTSKDHNSIKFEMEKLSKALEAGTDAVMDLSTGGDLHKIRKAIIAECPKPLGTVPVYEVFVRSVRKCKGSVDIDIEELFDVIEQHAVDGVDFMTVHCGLTMVTLERLKRQKRVTGIVSRGGAFMAAWMARTGNENPLYEHFDRLLKICKKHEVTLSLGDGLRPGCLADAVDRAMVQEMIFLGELAAKCLDEGVQTIIEGPGHMPLNTIEANISMQKSLCNGAPYYVLGPLVCDIAPGYDHITSAIGGSIAAAAGADFLCYVTPSEHLGLPGPDDVRAGVIASKIAAHAGDIVKLGRMERDREMSVARKALDWDAQERLSIDPTRFAKVKQDRKLKTDEKDKTCTMCGELCAYKVNSESENHS